MLSGHRMARSPGGVPPTLRGLIPPEYAPVKIRGVNRFASLGLLALLPLAVACGYRLQGAGPVSPREIYLEPLANDTDKIDLGPLMTSAVREELAHRARGRQPGKPAEAGAILSGEITYYGVQNVTADPRGLANRYEIVVTARVTLTGRDGRTLYKNERFLHREIYERTQTAAGFYDQEPAARKAIARAFARDLLDTLGEGF